MRNSDIFNSFAKIAQDKGIISNDSSEAIKELEKTNRSDSLTISAIEALYGVKPQTSEDMNYDKNIMEKAHEKSVVVSPAYDKLNGLVENNIERQNILLHIVKKNPDGLLTQRKYAQNELILSLVRVANDLDNQEKNKLRILADNCLYSIKKQAFVFLGLAGSTWAWIGGTLAGISWLVNNLTDFNQGFHANHNRLVDELNDLIEQENNLGFGFVLNQKGKELVEGLIKHLNNFKDKYESLKDTLLDVREISTLKDVKNNPEQFKQLEEAYINLQLQLQDISVQLKNVINIFNNRELRSLLIEKNDEGDTDIGVFSKLLESTLLTGKQYSPFKDDFQDVVKATPPYIESLNDLVKLIKNSREVLLNKRNILNKRLEDRAKLVQKEKKYYKENLPKVTSPLEEYESAFNTPEAISSSTLSEFDTMKSNESSKSTLPEFSGMSSERKLPSSTLNEFKDIPGLSASTLGEISSLLSEIK